MPASETVSVRPARDDAEDRRYVWKVNNDPSVRERSINTDSIPWEDHIEWYAEAMSDPDRLLYVTQHNGEDCGVVRYDLDRQAREAEISIALQTSFRGRHIGRRMIKTTSAAILEHEDVEAVVAHVRPDNTPSVKAFEAAGYADHGREVVRGVEMIRLECEES